MDEHERVFLFFFLLLWTVLHACTFERCSHAVEPCRHVPCCAMPMARHPPRPQRPRDRVALVVSVGLSPRGS